MSFGNDCGPKPSDPVEATLWAFATFSNWNGFHPEDDNRFYEFVVVAMQNESAWDREAVEDRLREYGLPERHIEPLGVKYWAGRCALVKEKKMKTGDIDPVW
jgi:hypothetical protein